MDFSVFLDTRGYSRYRRDLVRITELIGQYLEDKCTGRKIIPTGGRAECSNTAGSDTDVMEVADLFKVMEKNMTNVHTTGMTPLQKRIPVYISRKCCNAGYCRVELPRLYYICILGYTLRGKIKPCSIYKQLLSITQECNERYYISSKLFHDKVIPEGFDPPDDPTEPQFISNGPAMTYENIDIVNCLQLEEWPTEAKTWSSRERHNNWPNKELISHLAKNVSCYVVPIGSKLSKESDLEWRISFADIERNLIWNMNDTQFKCFVLLKALNREYMESTISTYHIKNIALWLCEELPETNWINDHLITCVKAGLKKLRHYVEDGYLPHYFVPNNNLFLNKSIRNPDKKKHALKLLDGIYYELEGKLIKQFGITHETRDFLEYVVLSPDSISCSYFQSLIMIGEYCRRCGYVLMFVTLGYSQTLCANIVKRFGQDCKDILPCIRLALTKIQLRKRSRTYIEIDDFIVKMKKENEIDDLTVVLNCGMVYFVHRRYFDVRNALIQQLNDWSIKNYITCKGEHFFMCLRSGDITDIELITSKEVEDIRTHHRNLVMVFL